MIDVDVYLKVATLAALTMILVLTLVMVLSCYDSGVFGTVALGAMGVSVLVVLLDFERYALSRPTVILSLGFACFLTRNYINFILYRLRRKREGEQLIEWPFGRMR